MTKLFLAIFALSKSVLASPLVDQWKEGLSGTKLTPYSDAVINSKNPLTVVNFYRNGRYQYYKEGNWSVQGTKRGESNNTITGRWDIQQRGYQFFLTYVTDGGQTGNFPIYLQNDGRLKVGGASYTVELVAESGRSVC